MGPISAAAQWITALVSGSMATILAILAVAGVGLAMLQGRLPVRRAISICGGIFLLFGAPALARSLIDLTSSSSPPSYVVVHESFPRQKTLAPVRTDDPYAGAVPRR